MLPLLVQRPQRVFRAGLDAACQLCLGMNDDFAVLIAPPPEDHAPPV